MTTVCWAITAASAGPEHQGAGRDVAAPIPSAMSVVAISGSIILVEVSIETNDAGNAA
ncbi:MAG: hypothetical protein JO052_22785 [Bradyrhizobium sp.]|nr:hypothetical protein [Bradyrhizobium sp.]